MGANKDAVTIQRFLRAKMKKRDRMNKNIGKGGDLLDKYVKRKVLNKLMDHGKLKNIAKKNAAEKIQKNYRKH